MVIDLVGQPYQPIGRDHALVAVTSGNRGIGDPVSNGKAFHLGTKFLDDHSAFVAGNERQPNRNGAGALQDFDIVHTDRRMPEPHFTRPEIAQAELFPSQVLGTSVLVDPDGMAHRTSRSAKSGVLHFDEASSRSLAYHQRVDGDD